SSCEPAACSAPQGGLSPARPRGPIAPAHPPPAPPGNRPRAARVVPGGRPPPPVINVSPPVVVFPPNHTFDTLSVADLVASVTDSCDASLGVGDAVITNVTSDEPVDATGDGHTSPDIVIGADCRSVQLRVERQGCGNGRVY